MPGRLQDKVAVITGAGSGMGKAMAQLFAEEGAKVVIGDISGEQDEVAAAIGESAVAVHCDVSDEEQVRALIATACDRFGRLDVLCNNAGFGGGTAPLHEQSAEHWDRVHATNIKGVFLGMKYGIAAMLESGGGAVVNTGSASAVVGWKHHGVYASAKAGVHHMTRVAALDYSDRNIRVNAIAPGPTDTEATRSTVGPFIDQVLSTMPIKRMGTVDDMAAAVLFLLSDDAAFITGHVLNVDGGQLMRV